MDTQWRLDIVSNSEIVVRCDCGIYYDMEYRNLCKLQNNLQFMYPNIRIVVTKDYPVLTGRGRFLPDRETLMNIIEKNHDSFSHPPTNRRPPSIEQRIHAKSRKRREII